MATLTFANELSDQREPTAFVITAFVITEWNEDGTPVLDTQAKFGPFRCWPEIPGTALDDLTTTTLDVGDGVKHYAPSIIRFLKAITIPPDRVALDAMFARDGNDLLIPTEHLANIMNGVVEALTGRPTQR